MKILLVLTKILFMNLSPLKPGKENVINSAFGVDKIFKFNAMNFNLLFNCFNVLGKINCSRIHKTCIWGPHFSFCLRLQYGSA